MRPFAPYSAQYQKFDAGRLILKKNSTQSRNSENVVRNDSHPEKRRMSEEERRIANRSKKLSFLLRHDKDYPFGEHGWREVSDLMENHGYSMEELNQIVATNNIQRFEFSEDKTRIRARQGHSIEVDVELEETTPPDILYHGTAVLHIKNYLLWR